MKVDYHIHLEEGPYSMGWLTRTHAAYEHFASPSDEGHTRSWLKRAAEQLHKRMEQGGYSEGWLDLYLEEAVRKGIQEVGIVDHLYRFQETKSYFERFMIVDESDLGRMQSKWLEQVMTETMTDFFHTIENAKEKWRQRGVTLRVGIEADYFPGGEEQLQKLLAPCEWDYVIGSVHFIDGWGFDNPETKEKFEEYDLVSLYDRFFTTVEQAIRSQLFDFVAHLDNLKVFKYRPNESLLVSHYERIAEALIETDTATEINAGLFYRYPIKEMCPSPLFLDKLLQRGVVFTLSSDSHFPDDLGKYVAENVEMLKKLGVKEVAAFERRKRIMKAIEEMDAD
jgi:histidinol-phosphatase (PHP family)